MSRIGDPNKLSAKEQRALEQYARERSGSTLLKNERTAQFLQRERINERGEASVKPSDISRDTARTEKYGFADSTPPDLGARLLKLASALTWDAPSNDSYSLPTAPLKTSTPATLLSCPNGSIESRVVMMPSRIPTRDCWRGRRGVRFSPRLGIRAFTLSTSLNF